MSAWPTADLAAIAADDELRVAARRADGTLRDPRIVWHVVLDGACTCALSAEKPVRGTAGSSAPRPAWSTPEGSAPRSPSHQTPTPDDAINRAYPNSRVLPGSRHERGGDASGGIGAAAGTFASESRQPGR